MKRKTYRQNLTVIDTSKKARPPPGKITPILLFTFLFGYVYTVPTISQNRTYYRSFVKKGNKYLLNVS
ncbi:hypothetical protein [Flintibacter muris]|uniref:hypothetical protein n=1 Tax=Flintibacter muris TaxID=2941327 RepID=UPI0020405F61|nr:hypothetical protein [Flintibacter muris]